MFDFRKCRPVALNDLIRIGHESDGGYVLSKRNIEKTETLLSFGINDDWSFEDCFTRKKNVKVYAFDYSIKDSPWVNGRFYAIPFLALAYDAFTLRWRGIKRQFWRINASFKKFFNEKAGRYYIPKFIGTHDDDKTVCFKTVFEEIIAGGGGGIGILENGYRGRRV
jgi:hypothetical protein